MNMRLGGILFTPNTVMVLLAAGFFWALTYRRLYPGVAPSKKIAAAWLLAASVFGATLGIAHARIAGVAGAQDAFGLHLGSLGGYVGAILGAMIAARLSRPKTLPTNDFRDGAVADAFVPGVAAGGIVARIGCLFTGCCRGFAGFMHIWPFYDILALAAAFGISRLGRHPGKRAALFFIAYGLLRFLLEFARPSVSFWGPLSINAILALVQTGIAAACMIRR